MLKKVKNKEIGQRKYQNGVSIDISSNRFDISLKLFIHWDTPQLDVKILCCLVIC